MFAIRRHLRLFFTPAWVDEYVEDGTTLDDFLLINAERLKEVDDADEGIASAVDGAGSAAEDGPDTVAQPQGAGVVTSPLRAVAPSPRSSNDVLATSMLPAARGVQSM